jgi:transcriptional regulator with XRE-family HTH domain/Zn-dependent peptidase ImmA (M78 family)
VNLKEHLSSLEEKRRSESMSDKLQLEESAVREQVKELENEIKEYHEIWGSRATIPALSSLQEIPGALIRARLSLGLSQKDLANTLGLKEQQIQRYEATDYQTASLATITEILKVLKTKVPDFELAAAPMTLATLYSRLEEVGLDRSFLLNRLLPLHLASQLEEKQPKELVVEEAPKVAFYLSRLYGWSPQQILGFNQLNVDFSSLINVKFKVRKDTNEKRLMAYSVYAHYLALLITQATSHLQIKRLPVDPYQVHKEAVGPGNTITIESALRYVWGLGVPIIPLEDRGGFQGAHFKEDQRSVIILKQKTTSTSKWLFDLFHEFWHATQHQDQAKSKLLEFEDFDVVSKRVVNDEERISSQFAGAVLLGRNPNDLIEQSLELSGNNLWYLKNAVQEIATEEKVQVDALANCVAFRLSQESINWWGAAQRLQSVDPEIQSVARDVLLENSDLSKLSTVDLDLLRRALGPIEVKP